jgi:peptidoglycan/LPS O-acetylase OafA/YrhL
LKYRGEIDGLRALAVASVILFHAGVKSFGGGFVGVDVFFVISGYLITTLIISEKQAGKFSLLNFYERRARRILPALFFVALCCIPFAWLWMLPGQQKGFARSLIAVIFFVSNILFSTQQRGYWAPSVDDQPLLHTWSLAVEEQYYLLFPLFIILAWRYGRRAIFIVIAIVAALSLGLAQYESGAHPIANFYILPTRAWEIFIGAAVAMFLGGRACLDHPLDNFLSGLGLFLIVFSVFSFSAGTPFPGVYGLVPTCGAALVILSAGPKTYVNKLLTLRPLVGLGLISYSAYLWHQPIFAFARMRSLYDLGGEQSILLAGLSVFLAWLTWLLIETPFRNGNVFVNDRLRVITPLAFSVLLLVGLIGTIFGEFPLRDNVETALELRIRVNQGLSEECDYNSDFYQKPVCTHGANPVLAIWGDSFAMHLVDGIENANPTLNFVQATRSACGPFIGLSLIDRKDQLSAAQACLSFNRSVLSYLEATPEITDVVVSGKFNQYVGPHDFLTDEGIRSGDSGLATAAFEQTIRKLEVLGKRVWVISPPAMSGDQIGGCLIKQSRFGGDIEACAFPVTKHEAYDAGAIEFLRTIQNNGTRVVWLPDFTCSTDRCAASEEGVFLYRDAGHLSHEGSGWIGSHTTALKLQALDASKSR